MGPDSLCFCRLLRGPNQGAKTTSANDISNGHRNHVGQKAGQIQGGEVNSLHTTGYACRQKSGRDIVHISNAVFKPADDKEAHRYKGPDGPPRQHAPRREPPAPDDAELDQLIESIQGDETEE